VEQGGVGLGREYGKGERGVGVWEEDELGGVGEMRRG